MKKLVLLIMIGAFLAAGGTALALDAGQHVIQAPNSEGDLMFFPVGVALDGWDTKITVTNTSHNRSAVAKVIVRGAAYSRELLDFLIYLSPTDVWTGTLKQGAAGPVMYSDDDSCLSGPGVWANVVPMNQPLVDACSGGTNEIVYVTVIEAWSSNDAEDEARDGVPLCDLWDSPVSKDCIKDAYDGETGGEKHFGLTNDGPYNILTGHYELSLLGALTIGDRAEVLRDYDNTQYLDVTALTLIGTGAMNNLCEIEAALSKNHLAMPYYNDATKLALHWVTFVTKLTQDCNNCEVNGPFSAWDECDDVVFSPLYFDLMENTPGCEDTVFSPSEPPEDRVFPYEVNFLFTVPDFIHANYEEGWVDYDFDYATTCTPLVGGENVISYTGAPAIASSWLLNENGLCLIPSAHVDGTVKYNEAELIYYQYYNSDNSEY